MIEVALPTVMGNHLAYNWSRLPEHTKGEPFYVDLIFSKTVLTKPGADDPSGDKPGGDKPAKEEK